MKAIKQSWPFLFTIILFTLLGGTCYGISFPSHQIYANDSFTLFIDDDGYLHWSGEMQLGEKTSYKTTRFSFFDPGIWNKEKSKIAKVASGDGFCLYLLQNGHVYAQGSNIYGQLGENPSKQTTDKDIFLFETDIIDIAAGNNHILLLADTGKLYTMGRNHKNQLGNGNTQDKATKQQITSDIVKIFASGNSSFAINSSGTLLAWGDNQHGQLGIPNTKTQLRPKAILKNISDVWAGKRHVLAKTNNNKMYAWGENDHGQLGINNDKQRQSKPKYIGNYSTASTGETHSLLLDEFGNLYACGNNQYAQLGINTDKKDITTPHKVNKDISAISCGRNYSVVLSKNGILLVSGENAFGQLGTGDKTNQTAFTEIKKPDAMMSDGILSETIVEYINTSDFTNRFGDIYAGRWRDQKGFMHISIVNLPRQEKAIADIQTKFPECTNNISFTNATHTYTKLKTIQNEISTKMNTDLTLKYNIKINSVGISQKENKITVGLATNNKKTRDLFKKHIHSFPDIIFTEESEYFDQ